MSMSITGTSLNNGGDIRISIEPQDVFTHSSENNAIMHLFNRIEYHLSNQLIESLNYPGQATTMRGLIKYADDFSKAQGLNQLWYKDTSTTAVKVDNNGFAARHAYLIQSSTVAGHYLFEFS